MKKQITKWLFKKHGTKLATFMVLITFLQPSWLNSQTGSAVNFDGSNDYINIGTQISGSITGTNKITVEAWVKPSTNTGNGAIVGNYATAGVGTVQYLLRRDGSNFTFWTNAAGFIQLTSIATVTLNTWTHVAGTWDGAVMRMYVNGVPSGTVANTASFVTSSLQSWIGGEIAGAGEYFNGNIDEVRLWNRALCPAEILNNMNAELTAGQYGLMAYYKLNQGTAGGNNLAVTTATDASVSNITGTLTNLALTGATSNWVTPGGVVNGSLAPVFTGTAITVNSGSINLGQTFTMVPTGGINYTYSSGSSTVSPVSSTQYTVYGYDFAGGCLNKAVSTVSLNGTSFNFDGTNDVANLGTALSTSLNNSPVLTLETWVKPSNVTGIKQLVGNHTGGVSTQFCLRQENNRYNFFIGQGLYGVLSPVNSATAGVWQHIAAVFNNTVLTIYVNGVPTSSTIPAYSFGVSSNIAQLANNGFSEAFSGDLDEVRIWKRALCQAEIVNNMNAELALPQYSLMAYYKLNQGISALANPSSSLVTDFTGNTTGTLVNTALNGATSNWSSPGGVTSGSNSPTFLPLAVAGPSAICIGNSATLTASGNVTTYTWTGGPTTASYVVSPTVTTTYSVSGTNSVGCLSNISTNTLVVNPLPTIAVNNGTICSGQSFTINPSNANTYTIQGGSAVVSPTANATYTVIGTSSAGCVSSTFATSNVQVNSLPVITVSNGTICVGESFTLTPGGASTYTFQGGSAVVSPTATANYTVAGTSSLGCVSSTFATANIVVNLCTGIATNNIVEASLNIYPNPFNGVLNVDASNSNTKISIVDLLGKVHYSQTLAAGLNKLNLNQLNSGVYFIKAESNGSIKTIKLIKE